MAVGAVEPLDDEAAAGVPHAHALVERPGRDVAAVGRDGHRRDAILDAERQHVLSGLDVPEPDRAVAAAGRDVPSRAREVERVDVLLVTGEGVLDRPRREIPDLDGRDRSVLLFQSRYRPGSQKAGKTAFGTPSS